MISFDPKYFGIYYIAYLAVIIFFILLYVFCKALGPILEIFLKILLLNCFLNYLHYLYYFILKLYFFALKIS